MSQTKETELRMAELAERTGVPPRTIRLYIARGLVEGPLRRGRRAAYGPEHVQRLEEIRRLQQEGLTLGEISQRTVTEEPASETLRPEAWWHYTVGSDVVVSVRHGVSPWRQRAIQRSLARMAAELADTENERETHEYGD